MKHKILITGPFASESLEFLAAHEFDVEHLGPRDLVSPGNLIAALRGKVAYILGGDEVASSDVLSQARELRVVSFMGAGYEAFVDAAAARSHGIQVTNTPGANRQGVAEMALGLMLAAWRQIPHLNETTRGGKWSADTSRDLFGATLGIVGAGHIGTRLAEIAHRGFEMKIMYVSRSRKPALESAINATWGSLSDVLAVADVVSLHLPYDPQDPQTAGYIGAAELRQMRKASILVNTARAQVVDGFALYEALACDTIAAAAFDGYYSEPAPISTVDDPYKLTQLPSFKFLVTPHCGWRTVGSENNMCAMAARNTVAVLSGLPCEHVVNP